MWLLPLGRCLKALSPQGRHVINVALAELEVSGLFSSIGWVIYLGHICCELLLLRWWCCTEWLKWSKDLWFSYPLYILLCPGVVLVSWSTYCRFSRKNYHVYSADCPQWNVEIVFTVRLSFSLRITILLLIVVLPVCTIWLSPPPPVGCVVDRMPEFKKI